MSRPDVLAELRATRPAAPPELRARVRELALAAPPPRRRLTRRRGALVLVPALAAAAVAAGVVALDRGGGAAPQTGRGADALAGEAATKSAPFSAAASGAATVPSPSPTRLQDYAATLSLRVHGATALSDATKQAVRIARSLGGFASSVSVDVHGRDGDATLRLRVPVGRVEDAVQRLSALGTITGEAVSVRDVQAGVNAADREIARLQRQLRELRARPQTGAVKRQIAAVTAHVQRLQRSRAGTVRQARLATVSLRLTTRTPAPAPKPARHGALHGALVALGRLGVGALYAVVVGGPVVLLLAALWLGYRALRRRGERRLLGG